MYLSVETMNSRKLGTVLDYWKIGGEHKFGQRPFDPYFFSTVKIPNYPNTKQDMKDITTHKPISMWKVEFPDTQILTSKANANFTTDDDIPYLQRVAIDKGFYCNSPLPVHYAWDVETFDGQLRAVAWYGYGKGEWSAGTVEQEHLDFLNEMYRKYNPDIFDTYFGSYFDVQEMENLSKAIHVPLDWGRHLTLKDGTVSQKPCPPFIQKRKYHRGTKEGVENIVKVDGRLSFDVYKEVAGDQTLTGIKDKKQRTVSEWFGFTPCVTIDYFNMDKMSDEDLGKACLSHAKACWEISDMYLNRLYYFAEDLGLPLNLLFERTPSHIPNYLYMRELESRGWISRGSNKERYPEFFKFGRKGYQGALTKLYNFGQYTDIFHDDFKSMYPTIMAVFNLSPDSLRLISVSGESSKYSGFETPLFEGKRIIFFDNKLGRVEVEISDEDGMTRQYIRKWMKERNIVKEKLKADPDNARLESWQWGLKVNLNQIYGYHGMAYARYGCAPIAALVTAIGRWWLWLSIQELNKHNLKVFEVDTDGIYHSGRDMSKHLVEVIKSMIPERYDKSFIRIDCDHYKQGIFYEEKSYLLEQDNGKILFHGSGLKGRQLPKIVDKAAMELAKMMFEDPSADVSKLLRKYGLDCNLAKVDLADLVMTVELGKEDYDDKNVYGKLVEMCKRFNINTGQGVELQFIKCKNGYIPFQMKDYVYKPDYAYYRGRIASVLSRILGPTKRMGVDLITQRMVGETELKERYT